MTDDSRTSGLITIGLAIAAVMLAILMTVLILDITAAAGNQSPIAGDPPIYHTIAAAVLDGRIPYVEVTVEHLPGALIPMLLIGGVSSIADVSFPALWPFAMGIVFVISVGIANRLPTTYDSGRRYLLLSLPLLPLVLFRVEPWLMVWVVASLSFAFRSEWRKSSVAAVVASLTKGWPILLFALPFRAGQRRIAVRAGILTALLLLGIALLPGFREGRTFDGIHSETIVGSILLACRGAIGASPQIIRAAGAAYVGAGTWAVVLNIMIGLPFVLIGIRALARSSEVRTQTVAIGLVVAGVILGSPLLSAQFVFWLVPFVLFLKPIHRTLYFAASAVTLATMIWWEPAELAWSALVVSRNGLLIALAIGWALSLRTDVRETSSLDHVA